MCVLILATGAGFLTVLAVGWMVTSANPFVIASWNLKHHAEFYVEYPRSYRSGCGSTWSRWRSRWGCRLLSGAWLGSATGGKFRSRSGRRCCVLVLINLTGRNMGEVARLWMLFMPPLLVAAGVGMTGWERSPAALGATAALLGAQTLALQGMIQVVYPV